MDTFGHIKSVIVIILGLSIAKLLQGAVRLIQHPGRTRSYWVHLLWALYIFLLLIHFWWWEYRLKTVSEWSFQAYSFVILYITLYYTLCALLFPDDVKDYNNDYEAYFYSRKKWFFGVLAVTFLADVIDTILKGKDYFLQATWEYPIRNTVHFLFCVTAMWVSNKRFHAALVIFFILYELSYILRLFDTVS
ncbi:hypothetical protein ACX0G9_06920 [Flavitalea flava]